MRLTVANAIQKKAEGELKKFLDETSVPDIDGLNKEEISVAAKTSNEALGELAPNVQWVHSYFVEGKTFCTHLAENEDARRKHSTLSDRQGH